MTGERGMTGERAATWLGAEGAAELVAWLGGTEATGRIELRPDRSAPPRTLVLRRPAATAGSGAHAGTIVKAGSTVEAVTLLDRHVLSLAPYPPRPATRPAPPALPSGVLLLTNAAALPTTLDLPPDATVLTVSADALRWRDRGGHHPLSTVDDLVRSRPTHIRVLVDATDPALTAAGWSTAARALLRLHEWTFRAVQACAGWLDHGSSVLVTVLGGVTDTAEPRPYTGLFTGLVKSLALELPEVAVLATVHAGGDPAAVLARSAAELGMVQFLPVSYHAGGQRLTVRAARRPPRADRTPSLTRESLVLAAGGGRGIGAEVLLALARRYRPRIVVLGSTALDRYPPELLDADPADPTRGRAAFIKRLITGPDRIPVGEANARYDRLQDARATHRTMAELTRHCGRDRVRYLRCDLRDGEAVRAAVAGLPDPVDLLLNVAGVNRSADLRTKTVEDFLAVRDLKVRTYLNLKDALADRPPRRWCNFGSFIGFTGQRGEPDYAAANDFLYSSAESGHGEFTIGWGLWGDVGLGAAPIKQAFLARIDQYTPIPATEGVAHFLAELADPAPATVLFGDKERAAITAALPGYLDFCGSGPFVDSIERAGPDRLTVARAFDLARDGYLDLHQVDGYPTLPGTFVPELAAEAATALVPHRIPVVFTDLRLESFLRVYGPERPVHKRIHARLVRSDRVESVVEVRVTGDVVAANGRVLVRDKPHFSVTVRLRDAPTPAPSWQHWDEHGCQPLTDPYHLPGAPVLLRDVFRSTTDTRTHPLGRRGRLALDPVGVRRWFPDLLVPALTLDGLIRVAVLDRVEGRWTPVAIPRYVRRIDLYGTDTDATLAASGEPVELYVTPAELDLENPEPDNRALAVRADGRVLLQVKDIIGTIVGYLDQKTGRFVDRSRFDSGERAPESERT